MQRLIQLYGDGAKDLTAVGEPGERGGAAATQEHVPPHTDAHRSRQERVPQHTGARATATQEHVPLQHTQTHTGALAAATQKHVPHTDAHSGT